MRIALLADLHANREATEACLAELARQGCDHYVFLGDLVGYGADPGWVVDAVRARVAAGSVAVLGNHDQAVLAAPSQQMVPEARAAIAWTRQRLDAGQLAFLGGLPMQVEEDDRLYVHANAWAPERWGYVSSRASATRSLEATTRRLSFCGHEHRPALYYAQPGPSGHFQPVAGRAMPLPGARRWLAIPGACGQPRDGDPAACCAVYDAQAGSLTFLRVPYDHERAAARIVEAGLPQAFAARLLTGA